MKHKGNRLQIKKKKVGEFIQVSYWEKMKQKWSGKISVEAVEEKWHCMSSNQWFRGEM
jgi:hypothetical protein